MRNWRTLVAGLSAGLILAFATAWAQAQQRTQQAPVRAAPQSEFRNPISDFFKLFSPPQAPPPVQAPRPAPKKRVAAPPPMVITDQPAEPRADPTTFVLVVGDSLSELLAAGLAEAYEANPDVQVLRRGRSSSGLVRDDYFDWRKSLRDMLGGNDKITHVVMMIGSNDRQQLKDAAGATLEPFTDAWREAYGARVDEIAALLNERGIPLFWVGMPPMQNGRMSADMLALNEIVRSRLAGAKATYVDIWEAFVDQQNRYAVVGPSLTGETTKLRAGDGIHFTKAGARMAAHFVEIELKRSIDKAPPTPVFAMPADPNAADPASVDPALQPGGIERLIDEQVRRGLDGLPPLNVVIPTKAAAGPILPLNAPETASGGALLTGRIQRTGNDAGRAIERVLVDGKLPDAKPGRADDFRWPAR
ncbi:SGNH family hydrolase [uncultured Alsobacter sp.]|uniref:SGNH/GDSL hydrolase family protein n=1 Tax=uncultured Alsobacter sp. TaxID=1748258 RepID=UPI0025FD2B23|nr:SGNH family hydrolase [uncultured Alsobacter sp.]